MLSLFKDSSGKIVLDITGCDEIKEVKILKMKDLGLKEFDQQMFGQLRLVEEMDVSGNQLSTIPGYISFPLLRKLDCSRNNITDLTFISQFPSIEELVVTDNPVVVYTIKMHKQENKREIAIKHNKILSKGFSDLCIANSLCPSLKMINDQEFNIQTLRRRMKDKISPVITKVWQELFAPIYSASMSEAAFQSLNRKFRVVLGYKRIAVAKLNARFRDFMMSSLTDAFLKNVRSTSLQHLSTNGRNYSNRMSRVNAVLSKDTILDPVIWSEESVSAPLSISDSIRPAAYPLFESEVGVDVGELVFEKGDVVLDDCSLPKTSFDARNGPEMSYTGPVTDDSPVLVTDDTPVLITTIDADELVEEEVVVKTTSENGNEDATGIDETSDASTGHVDVAAVADNEKLSSLTKTVVEDPKPVKFWLYDTDGETRSSKKVAVTKPTRSATSIRPPRSGRGRGKGGRSRPRGKKLQQYLVGPLPLYGWSLVAAMSKEVSVDVAHAAKTSATVDNVPSASREESPPSTDAPSVSECTSLVVKSEFPATVSDAIKSGSVTNSDILLVPVSNSSVPKVLVSHKIECATEESLSTAKKNAPTSASMNVVLLGSKIRSTYRNATTSVTIDCRRQGMETLPVSESARLLSETYPSSVVAQLPSNNMEVDTASETPIATTTVVKRGDGASEIVSDQTGLLSTLAAVACTFRPAPDKSTVDVHVHVADLPSINDGVEPPTKKKRVRFVDQVKTSS